MQLFIKLLNIFLLKLPINFWCDIPIAKFLGPPPYGLACIRAWNLIMDGMQGCLLHIFHSGTGRNKLLFPFDADGIGKLHAMP
jgi:hypothetical protein